MVSELRKQEQAVTRRIKTLEAALRPISSSSVDADGVHSAGGGTHGSERGTRDWTVALLLCALLGYFGAHRFNTGHTVIGLLQLVTVRGMGIWWLVDLALIISGKYRDSEGFPLSGRNPAAGSGCAWAVGVFILVIVLGSIVIGGLQSDLGSGVMVLGLVAGVAAFFLKYLRARNEDREKTS